MQADTQVHIKQEKKKKIELLAPAGSFDALKAAVENGADAVYLGGKLFNARASAANFDLEELKRAITYAHEREVKVYVTVNILVGDSEFPELADYLYDIYSLGADAVIVQDLGVAHFIRSVLPEMEIHASTQMTQNNSFGIRQLEKIGFSRVVLARETSAAEIEKIIHQSKLEVEVFVHGALCISYSGQCLMSSYIGARSGNRGRCAQPCRLPYKLVGGKGKDLLEGSNIGEHLLSPRDLNLSEDLAELKRIGVTSLKIEGRMKRPEYVATVVRIYRKALDSLEQDHKNDQQNQQQNEQKNMSLDESDKHDLTQVFNRDFTTGYFKGYQGKEMMSFSRPNNRGTRLGRITEIKNNRMILKLDNKLSNRDGIEIWTGRGREGMTVDRIFTLTNNTVDTALAGESVALDYSGYAGIGDRVFKTHDEELIEQARLSYREGKETRKRSVRMKLSGKAGDKLQLQAWDRNKKAEAYSLTEAQEAIKRPLEYEYLLKQLGRLGNTPLFLEELEVDLEGDIIIPVSELNEMRREVVEKLLFDIRLKPSVDMQTYKERLKNWKRDLFSRYVESNTNTANAKSKKLSVAIRDYELIEPLISSGADKIILGGESWRSYSPITLKKLQSSLKVCKDKGLELIWRLPRITNEAQCLKLKEELMEISSWEFRPTIMAANLAGIEIIQEIDSSLVWVTDHFLHVYNKAALSWVLGVGAEIAGLSSELNNEQLRTLVLPSQTEILVFGDMEMMVSEYCPLEATLSPDGQPAEKCKERCGKPCHKDEFFLQDRLSYRFPVETDRACRMHIFNARRLNLVTELATIADMGIKNIRLELLRVTPLQAELTTKIFKGLWNEKLSSISRDRILDGMRELEDIYPDGFTKGHFYRGVLT